MVTTYSKTGADGTAVSVTFSGELRYRVQPDKRLLVQVPPGGSFVVQSYTPGWTGTRNGAIKYPAGWRQAADCDADSRQSTNPPGNYSRRVDMPTAMIPGDVLIICKSHGDIPGPPGSYYTRTSYMPGLSAHTVIDQMLCIQCVDFDISPSQPAMLSPPAIGISPLAFQMRATPIPESMIDMSQLPSVINLAAVGVASGVTMPPISYYTALFAEFCGEIATEWPTHYVTPGLQHPGYGSFLSGAVSDAFVYLCSTLTPAQKYPLARAMVQWGLDLVGAWTDGRIHYPLGGHCQGRKPLIVLAGKLLGVWAFQNPSLFFPGDPNQAFQEDGAYFRVNPSAWWFDGWPYGWRMNPVNAWSSASPPNTNRGELLLVEPVTNEWGDPADPDHLAWGWKIQYMNQNCGSQIGVVLAAELMGMRQQFGDDMCGMVHQFMEGPPAGIDAVLDGYQTGIDINWGEGYSETTGGGKISQHAYTLYNPA